jgi:hypothetical protein
MRPTCMLGMKSTASYLNFELIISEEHITLVMSIFPLDFYSLMPSRKNFAKSQEHVYKQVGTGIQAKI